MLKPTTLLRPRRGDGVLWWTCLYVSTPPELHVRFSPIFSAYYFAFSALTLLVGRQEGHPACKKLRGGVLAWLFVWSDVQICIWPSRCHCHSLSLASVKSRLVLPFWYRLTRVVPDTGPLNGCVCACACAWRACVRACVCLCVFLPITHGRASVLLWRLLRHITYFGLIQMTSLRRRVQARG